MTVAGACLASQIDFPPAHKEGTKTHKQLMGKKIGLHIGFWLLYWLLNSYVEVFLSNSTFIELPFWQRMWKGFGTRLVVLPLEMAFTYYSLYVILKRYFKGRSYGLLLLEYLLLFTLVFTLYRLSIPGIIYPYIYHLPYPAHPFDEWLPRYIYTGIKFVSLSGIALTIKLLRLRVNQLEKEKQLTAEKLHTELRFLRAQTNPHFLFNTLNNIYALARKKSEATAPIVMKLSKLLRFMLYECDQERIVIQTEIQLIEDYIDLEKLRYNHRLAVAFATDIDDESTLIAPLLLLPLVENAFKHGTSETRFDAYVKISLEVEEAQLRFVIENAKESNEGKPIEGIGLPNVSRQLDLLYPSAHELIIEDELEFYRLTVAINLAQYAGTSQVSNYRR